jgi:hypothetical protein
MKEQEVKELFIFEILTIAVSIILTLCIIAAVLVVMKFQLRRRIIYMFSSRTETMLSQRQIERPVEILSHSIITISDNESLNDDM